MRATLSEIHCMRSTPEFISINGESTNRQDRVWAFRMRRLLRGHGGNHTMKRTKVLFLCTGNSCRSQMAEGWARHLKGDSVEAYSAGIETHGLNPRAVTVMAEAGVDISHHRSKHVNEFKDVEFDWIVTVCDAANESCPVFPGRTKRCHVGFEDPPRLAKSAKTEKEALSHYRRVRDEIRLFVAEIPDTLISS